MNKNEFDGREYGVGAVRGVRSFEVDDLGRLLGVSYTAPWKPGENVAACLRMGEQNDYAVAIAKIYGKRAPRPSAPKPAGRQDHSLKSCSHGFYAYYDGSNDYKSDARISAVVEGYGEAILGSRGFRAQKARIVALCIPSRGWMLPFGLTWNRVVWSLATGSQTGAALVLWLSASWALAIWGTICAVGMIVGVFLLPKIVGTPTPSGGGKVGAQKTALIRRNYPDVPVFGSFSRMIAAFPPDKGLEPSPTTDPNFWDVTA